MKLEEYGDPRKTKIFNIIEDGQEVGYISYTKKVVADMRTFKFTDTGRPTTPLFIVSAESKGIEFTNETLLQGSLEQLEDLIYNHKATNVTVVINEDYLEQYEGYGYGAIAYSEQKGQYLVIKYLN